MLRDIDVGDQRQAIGRIDRRQPVGEERRQEGNRQPRVGEQPSSEFAEQCDRPSPVRDLEAAQRNPEEEEEEWNGTDDPDRAHESATPRRSSLEAITEVPTEDRESVAHGEENREEASELRAGGFRVALCDHLLLVEEGDPDQ